MEAWEERVNDHDFELLFDPTEFSKNNPAPILEEFKLDENILKYWAIEGTAIRLDFRNKADAHGRPKYEYENNLRSRRGQKLSRPSDNPAGYSESKLKSQD